jgi:hypothetical protein
MNWLKVRSETESLRFPIRESKMFRIPARVGAANKRKIPLV